MDSLRWLLEEWQAYLPAHIMGEYNKPEVVSSFIFIFLKPDLVWKLTEEWKSYRADEPSEFYLKVAKIGGISFALFGIIMITLPFILE